MKHLKNIKSDKWDVLFLIMSILCYLLITGYLFSLAGLDVSYMLLNVLFSALIYGAILAISGRGSVALPVASLILFLIKYADTCVYADRLTHLRLSDLTAISQAARVASGYDLVWTGEQWKQLLMIVGLSAFMLLLKEAAHKKETPAINRLIGGGLLGTLLLVLIGGNCLGILPSDRTSGFDSNSYVQKMGLFGYWYNQARNSTVIKPEGYTAEGAEALLAAYTDEEAGKDTSSVNLIVIMNESLTDYSLLGETDFEDPLPNIHSMVESGELFEGKLGVSVLGGGTCNTEWEFLTGHTIRFLPDGAYAFMAYVNGESENIARDLKSSGYSSAFFHPYYSQEWNRDAVYNDYMGFDSAEFGDTVGDGLADTENRNNVTNGVFDNGSALEFGDSLEYVRTLVSDAQDYELLKEMLTLDDGTANEFLFNLTIQNHGGYTYDGDDFSSTEYVLGDDVSAYLTEAFNQELTSRPSSVNQYLTLTSLSDAAFAELIESLKDTDEPTIVLMFGDHQPAINAEPYIDLDETLQTDLEEDTHIVPYFVWSNFDLDYDFPEYTSANYLSAILKDCAGLPLTAWDQFRLNLMEEYPVITSGYVLDGNYQVVENAESTEGIVNYQYIQYMRMFEK